VNPFAALLASAEAPMPWYHGIQVLETRGEDLLLVFVLFVATLITVYYIQRWIGDY